MYAARRRQRHSVYNAAAHQSGSQALSFMPPSPVGTTTLQRQQDPINQTRLYLLGSHLIANHPNGFNMAFYDRHEQVAVSRAKDWAKEQDAVGFTGGAPTAQSLTTGLSVSDKGLDLPATISKVRALVFNAVSLAASIDGVDPKQAFTLKNIGLFSHGSQSWLSLDYKDGYDTSISDMAELAQTIASGAGKHTNIILYACNTGRGQDEDASWLVGSMHAGGGDSIAGNLRDELKKNKVQGARVWGHSTSGHATKNFALRSFSTSANAGAAGGSYVMDYAFTPFFLYKMRQEIIQGISAAGYNVGELDARKVSMWIYDKGTGSLKGWFYECYAQANKYKTYKGEHLAEMAPIYPWQVGNLIVDYWQSSYWPKKKDRAIKDAVKHFKLSAQGRNEQD